MGIKSGSGKYLDDEHIIGKSLSVEVSDHTYANAATGNERSVWQATGFRTA